MHTYKKEINQILDSLVVIYSDIKEYDEKRTLNKKIKTIKKLQAEKIYDRDVIIDVIEEERKFLKNILNSESLEEYDETVIQEDLALIDTLFDGISEGILDEE